MLKLFSYTVLFFSLSVFLYSQESNSQRYLEEYGDANNIVESISPNLESFLGWESIAIAPSPFGRSIGGVINNYIYVFGGQSNSQMAAAYNIATNTWNTSTGSTTPAYNPGFCVANNELYKISGTGAVNVFEKFTPDGNGTGTWTVLTAGPTSIMNAQNAIVWAGGDDIYAHSSDYSTPGTSFLWKYSISGNNWTMLTPTTLIKRYPGLVYYNGFLYLIGGLVPTGADQKKCEKYEIATNTWSPIASLPEDVNFCKWSSTLVGDKIVLVGSGGGYSTYPASPKIFYYNTSTDTWTYDSDTPAIRGLSLGFLLPGENKLFFGGGNEGGNSTNYQATSWVGSGGFIPVELISFNAVVLGNMVKLNWSTATETNNSGFEIQRKQDNEDFMTIAFVNGNGTTTNKTVYKYVDNSLTQGNYSYRLKQIDFNGQFEYSEVINVSVGSLDKYELDQNYPNPFNPSTTIGYILKDKSNVNVSVYNSLGEKIAVLVNEFQEQGYHQINFDATGLPSGIYYYMINTGNFSQTKKMLLMK